MPLFNSVKVFLTKEDFDFDSPDIDLHKFHFHLQMFLLPLGIFFNNKNSLLRLVWPAICFSLISVATTLEVLNVLHGIQLKDYSFATECFCYFVILAIIPLINCSTIYGRDHLLQILDQMNKDFLLVCKLNSKYRNHFLQNQLLIWKLCFVWIWFFFLIAIMYATVTLGPLVYQSLFAIQDEHTVRPLIFPVWLPYGDAYSSPNYEVLMCLELSCLYIYMQFFAVYVYIQFHVLLHNITILDIIIMDFGVIFEGLDEDVATLARLDPRRVAVQHTLNSRVKRIVTWHNSVFKSIANLSSVQGLPLVYQMMFSSIAVCLMVYQIDVNMEQGKIDIMFVMLFLGAIGQMWIPCYLGTILKNKGFAVADSCWNSGWHKTKLSLLVRADFIILILRSQQPLSIKFKGLPTLSLETFSTVVSTAYTYFNMLRQHSQNI